MLTARQSQRGLSTGLPYEEEFESALENGNE